MPCPREYHLYPASKVKFYKSDAVWCLLRSSAQLCNQLRSGAAYSPAIPLLCLAPVPPVFISSWNRPSFFLPQGLGTVYYLSLSIPTSLPHLCWANSQVPFWPHFKRHLPMEASDSPNHLRLSMPYASWYPVLFLHGICYNCNDTICVIIRLNLDSLTGLEAPQGQGSLLYLLI